MIYLAKLGGCISSPGKPKASRGRGQQVYLHLRCKRSFTEPTFNRPHVVTVATVEDLQRWTTRTLHILQPMEYDHVT